MHTSYLHGAIPHLSGDRSIAQKTSEEDFMKFRELVKMCIATALAVSAVNVANAAKYEVTIINGATMPVSPAVFYARTGGQSAAAFGTTSGAGFIALCQMGKAADRATELKGDLSVSNIDSTTSPIMPGQSASIIVEVNDPKKESLHFEAMYGKTKDTCAVASVNSHTLVALSQHVTAEAVIHDSAVVTGAFNDASLPVGMTYLDPTACPTATDAIGCIRELATPVSGTAVVRAATGLFPSLVTALEQKYGAAQVPSLLVPTGGAVQLVVKLKH